MLYMDCDESLLFQGKINRPVLNPARKAVIEHATKQRSSLRSLRNLPRRRTLRVG